LKASSYLTGQVATIAFSVQSECILNGNAHILYKHFLGKLWGKGKEISSLGFTIMSSSDERLCSTVTVLLQASTVSTASRMNGTGIFAT
jgi:hypothetical protein